MRFHASLILLASALQLGTVLAHEDDCPTQLKDYQPAVAYCSIRYPPAPTTVTVTVSPSTTSAYTANTPTTTPTSFVSSNDGRSTKTLTSIAEHTVWSCPTAVPTNCKLIIPTFSRSGGSFDKRSEEEESYETAKAEYESDLKKRLFGGFNFSENPALTWLRVLTKGSSEVRSTCACIQTSSKTITVSLPDVVRG